MDFADWSSPTEPAIGIDLRSSGALEWLLDRYGGANRWVLRAVLSQAYQSGGSGAVLEPTAAATSAGSAREVFRDIASQGGLARCIRTIEGDEHTVPVEGVDETGQTLDDGHGANDRCATATSQSSFGFRNCAL